MGLGSMLAFVDLPVDIFTQLFNIFVNGIPLEGDFQENQYVAGALVRILQTKQNLIQAQLEGVQKILQASLQWQEMPTQLIAQIANILGVDPSTLNLETSI